MLLDYIELKNFRQFKETQKVVFSQDPNKPITAIIGINTGGKTTLVQSFIWCLYGNTSFKDKEVLNKDKYNELMARPVGSEEIVMVRLKLKHSDGTYVITRTIKYRHVTENRISSEMDFSVKYEDINGALLPIDLDNYQEKVNEILPEELSDYFFFLGERIEKLDSRTNLSKVVEDFLGISVIKDAQKHLINVISSLNTKEDSSFSDKEKELTNRILNNSTKIKNNEDLINVQLNNIDGYKTLHKEIETELIKNPDSAPLKKKLNKLENKNSDLQNRLTNSKRSYINNFNDEPYVFFSKKMSEKSLEMINSMPESEKGLAHQSKASLEELLERGQCLCGADLKDKESDTYKNFINIFNQIAPKSIKAICDQYKIDILKNKTKMKNYPENVRDQFKAIRDIEDDISNNNEEISNLKSEIDNRKDLSALRAKGDEYLDKIGDCERKIGSYKKESETLEQENKRLIDQKESIMIKNQNNKKLLMYKKYAQAVLDDIKDDYDSKEVLLHEKLNNLVGDYFNQMYHGDRKLTLDKNYRIELVNDSKGTKTDVSTGLDTVKNFAFVAGLVEMAKEKISGDGENISEPYPLVLDAPFSSVDEIHVPNICRLLSNVVEQCVIVVMKKDWKYAEDIIEDKVGQYYVLNKQSETFTLIESGYNKEGE